MSTPVLYREPAPAHETGGGENQRLKPGELPSARSGQLAALADALFTSDLSARYEHTPIEVATAIRHAIGTHAGIGGCAAAVAAEYGERRGLTGLVTPDAPRPRAVVPKRHQCLGSRTGSLS